MKIDYQQALDLIASNNYASALTILDALLEQDSTFADAYYQRGQVKEKLQDLTGAIADYTQVIYLQPTAKAYISIALIEFVRGDFSSVITNIQSAINLDNSSPVAYRLLAQAYQKQNQTIAAIDTYKKATRCYLEKGDKKNARYCFEKIEKLNKTSEIVNVNFIYTNKTIVADFLKKAIAKLKAGDSYAALTDLDWLLNIEPNHPEALCLRGLTAAKLGNHQKAITDFAKAIQLEPHNKQWQYQRGIARLYLEDSYGALQEFTALLKQEQTNTDYLLQRGKAYVQLQQYDEAFKDYANALAIEPNNGELYLACGELQAILENDKDALKDYQKAAMIFLNQGDYQKHQTTQAKIQAIKAGIRQQQAEADKLIRIPIKYFTADRGSAVVEVVFNQQYTFDLVVDTGATMTLITERMQRIMMLNTTNRVWGRVADGRYVEFDVCHVNSLRVQKAIVNNLDVFVATRETATEGLLGQDFLSNYEVRILKDEIHLYPHI
jgi:tetratricopeptide (TPR) repeat protein